MACVFPAKTSRFGSWAIFRQVNDDARVQKALRRLAADKAPTSLSQLVMWNLSAGLDWETIAELSQSWSNRKN